MLLLLIIGSYICGRLVCYLFKLKIDPILVSAFIFLIIGSYPIIIEIYGTPCFLLPKISIEEAKRIVAEHEDMYKEIEKRSIEVKVTDARCPGRTEVVVVCGSKHTYEGIKKLTKGDFFGIPYRWVNV
jgi:hypothetical protein